MDPFERAYAEVNPGMLPGYLRRLQDENDSTLEDAVRRVVDPVDDEPPAKPRWRRAAWLLVPALVAVGLVAACSLTFLVADPSFVDDAENAAIAHGMGWDVVPSLDVLASTMLAAMKEGTR